MAHTNPKGLVFTGARARFTLSGRTVGYATNCSGSQTITYEPIQVLDHIEVVEHVPTGYEVTFTASRVRLVGAAFSNSLRSPNFNIQPKLGANDSEHLTNILDAAVGDLDAKIEDSRSGKIFMLLTDLKLQTSNWNITPRGIVGEDMTFVGIRMYDEIEASTA